MRIITKTKVINLYNQNGKGQRHGEQEIINFPRYQCVMMDGEIYLNIATLISNSDLNKKVTPCHVLGGHTVANLNK